MTRSKMPAMPSEMATLEATTFSRHLVERFGTSALFEVAPVLAAELYKWTKVSHAPDLLERILKKLKVPFYYTEVSESKRAGHSEASLRFVDGALKLEIDRATFRKNRGRARFSIAHEIAHLSLIYVFGGEVVSWAEESSEAYAQVESLCDLVASHILMPRPLLRDHFRRHSLSTIGIHSALKKFGVSKQALLTGIADTQPDLAAYNLRRYSRTEDEPATWRIANCGTGARVGTSAPWLPVNATVRKHLEVPFELIQLKPDVVWVGDVIWSMARKNVDLRALLCSMDVVDKNAIDQILLSEMVPATTIRQDVFDGIIAIVGPKETFDVHGFLPRIE